MPRRRDFTGLPTTTAEAAEPPDWLTEAGRACWPEVVRVLAPRGLAVREFTVGIALMAESLADYAARTAELAEAGATVPTGDGTGLKTHPAARLRNDAWDRLLRIAREFGLTPATFNAVKVNGNDPAAHEFDPRTFRIG